MFTTVEAELDEHGAIRPKKPAADRGLRHSAEPEAVEAALLSESALAADWDRPEEDAAWSRVP